ncbi:GNAT family N-acetyltransferase [Roseibium sp. MMSF_3544]|uniref:GNAT family N-acetyltransferase n=1 Tax=unclassified Roseibium TaxID=2629323 RepID=UPI00273F6ED7|nr:GNAT family N-acetyltransferase [Roseibium sp. MMSF_3544]
MLASIEDDFDFNSPDYTQLLANSNATAFQHPVWLEQIRNFLLKPHNARMWALTIRDTDGSPVFVMPLVARKRRGLRLIEMPDFGVTDYNAPVMSTELAQNQEQLNSLGADLKRLLPPHDVFRIRKVRAEHHEALAALFPGKWRKHDFSAHATDPFEDHALWRKTALRPSFVKTLDRKERGFFNSLEGRVRKLTSVDEIESAIDFIARIRAGRFDGDLMQEEEFRRFYAALAGEYQSFAEVYVLEAQAEMIGVVLGLVRDKRFYYLLIGCDYDTFGKYSPGYILYDEIYRLFIEEGGQVFDFTVGDERFKSQFGAKASELFEFEQGVSLPGKMAMAAQKTHRKWKRVREDDTAS